MTFVDKVRELADRRRVQRRERHHFLSIRAALGKTTVRTTTRWSPR